MNVLVIDDEQHGAEVLKLLLEQHCKHITDVALAYSAESGIAAIVNSKPDLVFLDIEMPSGTGFDVIDATKEIDYEVVFVTAYEQYALKAFKTDAMDYLLKPIDVAELMQSVELAYERIQKKTAAPEQTDLSTLMKKINTFNKRIPIPTSEGIALVAVDEILYLESDSNYTTVFLTDDRKMFIAKTLKRLEELLEPFNFCRVHSAYLVNLNEVERYIKGDGGQLILSNKVSIPVSRANKQELLDRFGL